MTYHVFHRTCWRPALGGRRPGAGRKTTIARVHSEAEARALCQHYNATHDPGPLSRKAEYMREGAP